MESQRSTAVPPDTAREQLASARRAHDRSVRRATPPAGLILATSFFSGVLTLAPSHRGPGHALTIIALVWFIGELLRLSARNQWAALRAAPRPRWSVMEYALIAVAVLIGGVIGPHLLASPSNPTLASWALSAAVAAAVAVCLFTANFAYRRRSSRAWQR